MSEAFYYGWHQVALERELRGAITPTTIGGLPLILVRDAGGITAYDAICPHRGAHLGFGGQLQDGKITCPFHGRRIALGCEAAGPYRVRSYRTLSVGGLVFVLLSEPHENGMTAVLEEMNETHFFVQGFTLTARTPAELVVENGFDPAHFRAVHGLRTAPRLRLLPSANGELQVEGLFEAEAFRNVWHNDSQELTTTRIGFHAQVFSPNVCVSRLHDADGEHFVISGATPNGDGTCTIRVAVAARPDANGTPPSEQALRSLLRDSKLAYEQDLVVWEHRVHGAPSRLEAEDDLILVFHEFCSRFVEGDRDPKAVADRVR